MVNLGHSKGYTLTEVMLVVAIIGLIASLSAGMLIQVNRYFLMARARLDLQKEARAAMYIISREVRQAQHNTIVIDQLNSNQPYCSRITFTGENGNTESFYASGTNLYTKNKNDVSRLSTHLTYLAFTFPRTDDMTIISVAMTLQEASYQGQTKALHMASQQVQVMN